MRFLVSVIIPVYNGERFIEKAIGSALQQPEVIEVIVVDDGSTDKALEIVEQLKSKDSKIKICHHKNNKNNGRSASRNLGIKKASGNYIAFLDADDFYLENRFKNDKEIFEAHPKCDGVYNAIGVEFYREASLEEQNELTLFSVRKKTHPKDLFEVLIEGKAGHFSIDGLTVKRSVFDVVGYFNESLVVSEDTELLWRMALKCSLETGVIDKPLAMRGVHEKNVFDNENLYKSNRIKMYKSLAIWSSKNNISLHEKDMIHKWLWLLRYKESNGLIKDSIYWLGVLVKAPQLLASTLWIKYFPLVRQRQKYFSFLYRK